MKTKFVIPQTKKEFRMGGRQSSQLLLKRKSDEERLIINIISTSIMGCVQLFASMSVLVGLHVRIRGLTPHSSRVI